MSHANRSPARLIVLDPGHFHASLLQKEMYPALDARVAVYAPLGPELLDYLKRVSLFNSRTEQPTRWELDVHTSSDPVAAMLRDRPGDIVVLTGRNRGKIDRILQALAAGLHVLADKPWIISSADFPKLEEALDLAERNRLVAYDIMTERFEATSELQRLLVNTPSIFGEPMPGSRAEPGIRAMSIHHIMKVVAGAPLRRPPWFFDIAEYGEGLADVGTHVVDLVQWTAFAGQPIDFRHDIQLLDARRWPIELTRRQFEQVTGEPDFPPTFAAAIRDSRFPYFCNNAVHYTLRGIHVKLEILWNWEAPPGTGDIYEASFRGTKAMVEIRQGAGENHVPDVYVMPGEPQVLEALHAHVARWQTDWPGLAVRQIGREARLVIPDRFRAGHEQHFAQVARRFFDYLASPETLPAWERPNMLAKYYVSTKGVEFG